MSKDNTGFDVKALGEAMLETALGMVKAQQEQEEQWLAGLEKDPSQLNPFERGVAVADYKGEAVRQRHLATLAKSDKVRDTILGQADWCDQVVARLEKIQLEGDAPVTIN